MLIESFKSLIVTKCVISFYSVMASQLFSCKLCFQFPLDFQSWLQFLSCEGLFPLFSLLSQGLCIQCFSFSLPISFLLSHACVLHLILLPFVIAVIIFELSLVSQVFLISFFLPHVCVYSLSLLQSLSVCLFNLPCDDQFLFLN